MKYRHRDLRNVLERSSARETAIRVAVGNVCEQLLAALGVTLVGYVQAIGPVDTDLTKPQTVSEIKDAITQNGSSPKCWCKLNSANLSFHKLKHTGFF